MLARKISPELLFEQNKRLAFGAAKWFFRHYGSLCRSAGVTFEELNQEALVKFYECCEKFESERARLSTFAYGAIIPLLLNRVVRELRIKERTVSLNVDVKRKSGKTVARWSAIEDKMGSLRVSDPFLREVLVSEVQRLKGSKRDKDIFIERFGLIGGQPKTLELLGKRFGISKERARQIVKRLLTELRREKNLLTIFESIFG